MLIIISFYCNQGYISEFGLFLFGRALSSPPTPYQVLKIKVKQNYRHRQIRMNPRNFHFHAILYENQRLQTVSILDSLSLSC